jgi:hypothetical protein
LKIGKSGFGICLVPARRDSKFELKTKSGRWESNPHDQLGRLRLYH